MKLRFAGYLIGLSCLLLVACNSSAVPKEKINSFTFVDQNGEAFGTENLQGSVWIADFIFTNCHTVCQPMTAEMASLQEKFKEKNLPVHLISFTVDPEVDTPEKLNDYVQVFSDDLSNWHLLTGYSQEEIEKFAREQFQTIVQKPASSNQVIHSTNFYLIDQEGHRIGEYNYINSTFFDDLVEDIEKVLN